MRQYILPLLALLSVVLYLSTFVGRSSPEPLFGDLRKEGVTEVEIKKAGIEYLVRKTDGNWKLEKPLQWPADKEKVERLIEAALKTKVETPITEEEKDFEKYRVSDRGDYIILRSPAKSIKVYVGKRGPRYSLVYVRRDREDEVYLVDATFADELPTGKNSLRDRTIWKLPKGLITEVRWSLEDKRFSMIKTQNSWTTEDGKSLPQADVDNYLGYLSSLKASGFPEEDKLPDGALESGTLQISTKDGQYKLSLYKTKKQDYYILYDGHVYKTYAYQKDQIFREIKPEEKS